MNVLKNLSCIVLVWSVFLFSVPAKINAQYLPDSICKTSKKHTNILDHEGRGISLTEMPIFTNRHLSKIGALGTYKIGERCQMGMTLSEQTFPQTGYRSIDFPVNIINLLGVKDISERRSKYIGFLSPTKNGSKILITHRMNIMENKRSQYKKIVICNLLALSTVNALWASTSTYNGPYIALIMYSTVTYLCWKKHDFKAGLISGIVGLCIHTFELISLDMGEFTRPDKCFFFLNIVLPIPLIYYSFKVYQKDNEKD